MAVTHLPEYLSFRNKRSYRIDYDYIYFPNAADVPELIVVVRGIGVYGIDNRTPRLGPQQGPRGKKQGKKSLTQTHCSHERDEPSERVKNGEAAAARAPVPPLGASQIDPRPHYTASAVLLSFPFASPAPKKAG